MHPPAESDLSSMGGWFAGPKAENGDWFAQTVGAILEDHYAWRRATFPEDAPTLGAPATPQHEVFQDQFRGRLQDLLERLKSDVPFHSPRYAAHMISEQTLPSIAGYIAAMLYNPNNISSEAGPVTVRLELEASRMIARMLGYGGESWAHLTSGGTVANFEALWIARTVRYLPLIVRDMRASVGLAPSPGPADDRSLLGVGPASALESLERTFDDGQRQLGAGRDTTRRLIRAYLDSRYNVVERGLPAVCEALGSSPVVLLPETHHYCFEKAMDLLGFGRRALVPVRVDGDFRMVPEDLEEKLDRTTAEGRHIAAVVAVVGSTEEGAVDPVDRILDLRARREASGKGSFWLHADAAYGGYLRTVMMPRRVGLGERETEVKVGGRIQRIPLQLPEHHACDALQRLGECDSITVDPHKLGYIPYPAGAVCFKSTLVKPIARQDAPYVADAAGDVRAERRSAAIGVYTLEGSKPGAAAAAVWLSHTLIPLDTSGHGALVRETIRNACELHALLERYPELNGAGDVRAVCLCAPGSNIVCFAFRPAARRARLAELNALNRRIYERFSVEAGERSPDRAFFVSRTTLSPSQYSPATVDGLLYRLGVTEPEYRREGVFLLRCVLMNPWYREAKRHERYYVSELAGALYGAAAACCAERTGTPR